MKKTLKLSCAAAVAMVLSAPVLAGPTLLGTASNPAGVHGLLVDGTLYDVSFSFDSYANAFSGSSPAFLGNETGAKDAAAALASALNGLGATGLHDVICDKNAHVSFPLFGGCWIMTPFDFVAGDSQPVKATDTTWADVNNIGLLTPTPNQWNGNLYATTATPNASTGTGVSGNADVKVQYALAYAVYTAESAHVPEPASEALMGVALAALTLGRRFAPRGRTNARVQ